MSPSHLEYNVGHAQPQGLTDAIKNFSLGCGTGEGIRRSLTLPASSLGGATGAGRKKMPFVSSSSALSLVFCSRAENNCCTSQT